MGSQNSKKIQTITNSVEEIRGSIRKKKTNVDDKAKDQLQKALVNYSQELNQLSRGARRREIDEAQKLICQVTTELHTLSIQSDDDSVSNTSGSLPRNLKKNNRKLSYK